MTLDPELPEDDGATGERIGRCAEGGDPAAVLAWVALRAAREIAAAIDRLSEAVQRLADSQF